MEYNSFEQLPITLTADDISAILRISRTNAYALMHRADFPTVHLGKRLFVQKDKLLEWLDKQSSNDSTFKR